jgi:hypothetical protein
LLVCLPLGSIVFRRKYTAASLLEQQKLGFSPLKPMTDKEIAISLSVRISIGAWQQLLIRLVRADPDKRHAAKSRPGRYSGSGSCGLCHRLN